MNTNKNQISNGVKTAAIVSALNEQDNIANVLKVLLSSKDLDEVIVVDGGSTDKTAQISHNMGAKVVFQKGGGGKGMAMRYGVKSTDAGIIVFFDADLIGLSQEHISSLLKPVLENKVVMAVGIRGRHGLGKIAQLFIKIDPLWAIAGERAMRREVFEALPDELIKGFMVETALNHYCQSNNLPVSYVKLKGLQIIIKERKWGFFKGFWARLKMYREMLKIRALVTRTGKKK